MTYVFDLQSYISSLRVSRKSVTQAKCSRIQSHVFIHKVVCTQSYNTTYTLLMGQSFRSTACLWVPSHVLVDLYPCANGNSSRAFAINSLEAACEYFSE
jgi:hypothetical protein